MSTSYRLLRIALVVFGVLMLLVYPLAVVWPSGWIWNHGAPHESQYFMMIVGIYATLGVFLINAARNPAANVSLIWFTVWSSVVHATIHGGAVLRPRPHGAPLGRRPRAGVDRRDPGCPDEIVRSGKGVCARWPC